MSLEPTERAEPRPRVAVRVLFAALLAVILGWVGSVVGRDGSTLGDEGGGVRGPVAQRAELDRLPDSKPQLEFVAEVSEAERDGDDIPLVDANTPWRLHAGAIAQGTSTIEVVQALEQRWLACIGARGPPLA